MNKYQQAMNTLKKLVAKETPKKPKIDSAKNGTVYCICPKCGENLMLSLDRNYCGACGQKIDWEDFL